MPKVLPTQTLKISALKYVNNRMIYFFNEQYDFVSIN